MKRLSPAWAKRLRALGVAGFLFFLLKGFAWIALFVWGAKACAT